MSCLKLDCLNMWSQTVIAACLHVTICVVRNNTSPCNRCVHAQNLNTLSFSRVQKFHQCKILWEHPVENNWKFIPTVHGNILENTMIFEQLHDYQNLAKTCHWCQCEQKILINCEKSQPKLKMSRQSQENSGLSFPWQLLLQKKWPPVVYCMRTERVMGQ